MGNDDLLRRKKLPANAFKRSEAQRQPYERVLIVTEGQVTEPNYIVGLIKHKKLHTKNVVVDGQCGSDPMGVYRHAKKLYDGEKGREEKFDRVYCVFDKDGHANYRDALDAINRAAPVGVYHAVNSVPCFEYWVLLHFTESTRPFQAGAGQSSCELVVKEIKKLFPKYEKGMSGLYQLLEDKTGAAIGNSKKSLAAAETAGTDNPTTRMHLLVEYLYTLKK